MIDFSRLAVATVMLGMGIFSHTGVSRSQLAHADTSDIDVYELKVGQPFPDITLPSLEDGNPLSTATFRGQKLVLHIWASW